MLPSFLVISLASFALFISVPQPRYACIGSNIRSPAFSFLIACSSLSSVMDTDFSLSSMMDILVQSAPADSSLGFTVSASPSSAVWYMTFTGFPCSMSVSNPCPFDSIAAIFNIKVDFPSPGSPCIIVSFPYGIYGYQSH